MLYRWNISLQLLNVVTLTLQASPLPPPPPINLALKIPPVSRPFLTSFYLRDISPLCDLLYMYSTPARKEKKKIDGQPMSFLWNIYV